MGRWSDRHSRLTSVPEMDENEILSYLVFDKPISEVGQGDDQKLNAVAAQLATASTARPPSNHGSGKFTSVVTRPPLQPPVSSSPWLDGTTETPAGAAGEGLPIPT